MGGLYVNYMQLNWRIDRHETLVKSKLESLARSQKVTDKNITDLKSEVRIYFLAAVAYSVIKSVSSIIQHASHRP